MHTGSLSVHEGQGEANVWVSHISVGAAAVPESVPLSPCCCAGLTWTALTGSKCG